MRTARSLDRTSAGPERNGRTPGTPRSTTDRRHWLVDVVRRARLDGARCVELDSAGLAIEEVWSRVSRSCGVEEEDLALLVAKAHGLEMADVANLEPAALKLLPSSLVHKHHLVPLRQDDKCLVIATSNPTDLFAEQDVGFASGRRPVLEVAAPAAIKRAILAHYSLDQTLENLLDGDLDGGSSVRVLTISEPEAIDDSEVKGGPVVQLANQILRDAIHRGASDIHIEPGEDKAAVRFRVDGVLRHYLRLPLGALARLISRIKILSGLDIANRLRPQDGHARIAVGGRNYDLRVSTVPARGNEKAVIRVLDPRWNGLEELGLDAGELQDLQYLCAHREGIVLVTGPTGSGKTTTLYSALRELATEDVNVMTVEDPVEYELPGLTQIQVDSRQGITFHSALRAILRQDPDVVLVGEIRDTETAKMAVQASLTGHLVLATLHTNDACRSRQRLLELGLEPRAIVSSLRGVVAQLLVRRVCPDCVETIEGELTTEEALLEEAYGVRPPCRIKGCDDCGGTGFRGRLPVIEVLTMNSGLERLILDDASDSELLEAAIESGMRPLHEAAMARVRAGETTLAEVKRVLGSSSDSAVRPEREPLPETCPPTVVDNGGDLSPRASVCHGTRPGFDVETTGRQIGHSPHILLVDDESVTRAIARTLLEKEGYQVSEAHDGLEALGLLATCDEYSLVVLDLDMPRIGGREVLERARNSPSTACLPIVVLTGSEDADAEAELIIGGATACQRMMRWARSREIRNWRRKAGRPRDRLLRTGR